jgi:hypothetical protein
MSPRPRRPFGAIDARTQRVVLGLALAPDERAALLAAAGDGDCAAWRDASVLDGLVDAARGSRDASALVEAVITGALADVLAPLAGWTLAALAERWSVRELLPQRELAALVYELAARAGAVERRLEARFVEDLEALFCQRPRRGRRLQDNDHATLRP